MRYIHVSVTNAQKTYGAICHFFQNSERCILMASQSAFDTCCTYSLLNMHSSFH